jgi:hypothetical protein
MGVLVLLEGRWARWRAWCSDVRYKGGKGGCIMSCIVYTMPPFTDCHSCTTPIVVFVFLYLLLFNTTAYLVLISHLTDKGKRIYPIAPPPPQPSFQIRDPTSPDQSTPSRAHDSASC